MGNFIKKIFIILASLTVTLILLEISLIIYAKIILNNSVLINKDLKKEKEYLYAPKKNINIIVEDAGQKFIVKTNSIGIRESNDYSYLNESIILLGDSVIFGEVNQSETIDHFVEELTKIATLNFGVGGYNTWQEYEFFKDKYDKKFNTKFLVLGICINDIDMNYFRRAVGYNGRLVVYNYSDKYFENDNYYVFFEKKLKFFLKKSELVKFIYYKIKSIHFGSTYSKKPLNNSSNYKYIYQKDKFIKRDIDLTIKYIEKINFFANKNNINFFVTFLPHRLQFSLSKEEFKKISIQSKLESILVEKNIKIISTYDSFFKLNQKESIDKYWRSNDDIHLNAEGNKIIANDIVLELKKFMK